MNIEEFRDYCLAKPGVTESFPFGETALVFKVGPKMFALASLDEQPLSVNLKCDPERAVALRETFSSVRPGYHMNKKHWNTVVMNGDFSRNDLEDWIDHSYHLVLSSLPRTVQHSIRMSE